MAYSHRPLRFCQSLADHLRPRVLGQDLVGRDVLGPARHQRPGRGLPLSDRVRLTESCDGGHEQRDTDAELSSGHAPMVEQTGRISS